MESKLGQRKPRGLGRGLEALIAGVERSRQGVEDEEKSPQGRGETIEQIPVEFVCRGKYQPRIDINTESLESLASSIRAQGVVQPIVVRPVGDNKYEIIAGERRWRASQMAELETVPCVVKNVPDDAALAIALIENIQRESLNPIEEATALQRLIDEFGMTHQQTADAVGRSRAAVTNLTRLLDLEAEVKDLIMAGRVEMGHARAILPLPPPLQIEIAKRIAEKQLSVRETEALVKQLQSGPKTPKKVESDADTRRFEQDLAERLGAAVKIQHSSRGKGKLVIHYNSLDELEGIVAHIK